MTAQTTLADKGRSLSQVSIDSSITTLRSDSNDGVPSRFSHVDMLRGSAAFLVIVYHAREIMWVGVSQWLSDPTHLWFSIDSLLGLASLPFRYGGWGVPLFFVLSGYCIHKSALGIMNKNRGRLNLSQYYYRRAYRIYPVLFVALLFTAVIDQASTYQLEQILYASTPAPPSSSLGLFLCNMLALQAAVVPTFGSNSPLWTLSIEMQLYAIYPLLLLMARRLGCASLLLIAGVASLGFGIDRCQPLGLTCLAYLFAWSLGLAIAEFAAVSDNFRKHGKVWTTLSVILTAVLMFDLRLLRIPVPWGVNLLAIPAACLLLSMLQTESLFLAKSLLYKCFVFMGHISYSLYVTHVPFLIFLRSLMGGERFVMFWPTIAAIASAIAFATIFYYVAERPFLNTRPAAIK